MVSIALVQNAAWQWQDCILRCRCQVRSIIDCASACIVMMVCAFRTLLTAAENELAVLRRYVYQKAYVEFFVSPEKLEGLEQRLKSKSSITYMAINSKGQVSCSNYKHNPPMCCSW